MKQLFLLIIVFLSAANEAHSGDARPGTPGPLTNPTIASALQLTPAQKARMEALRRAFREEINPLRERLLSQRLELDELWAKSPLDDEAIRRKQDQIQAIENEMRDRITRYHLECRGVLTAEQQEKLGALLGGHHGEPGLRGDPQPALAAPQQ